MSEEFVSESLTGTQTNLVAAYLSTGKSAPGNVTLTLS